VEKLSGLLFQAYEGISKAVSTHSIIGLSLIKEELERKRLLFTGNATEKVEQEREDDLKELSVIIERKIFLNTQNRDFMKKEMMKMEACLMKQ